MDIETKQLDWHQAVIPGVQGYTDICLGPDGLVYGIADWKRFFVFDPTHRKVLHEEDTVTRFGLINYQQGPRIFVLSPNRDIYILFAKGIARVDIDTFNITMLAESPVPIVVGGDIHNGIIYFASESHLYSYQVPNPDR